MKRSRSHILEDDSLRQLRGMVPGTWVVRDEGRDYGIDVQIEIFDKSGNSTGLRCYGQLKATDNEEVDDSLSIKRKHFSYWLSHNEPTLLLRYYANSGCIRWEWAHNLECRLKSSAESVEITRFLKCWDSARSPDEVAGFLHYRRGVILHGVQQPFQIAVQCDFGGVNRCVELIRRMRRHLVHGLFNVQVSSDRPCDFRLSFSKDMVTCNHIGLGGHTLHLKEDVEDDLRIELALVVLFLSAARHNRLIVASKILENAGQIILGHMQEDLAPRIVIGVIESLGLSKTVELFLDCENKEVARYRFDLLHVVVGGLMIKPKFVEEWKAQTIIWAEDPPFADLAGMLAYNAGNALAGAGEWKEAIRFYELAIDREPEYQERAYYWCDRGATEFEGRGFQNAIVSYETAKSLDPLIDIGWKLADCLFHAGQYQAALNELVGGGSGFETKGCYPQLLRLVCEELVNEWGFEQQEIKNIPADLYKQMEAKGPIQDLQEFRVQLRIMMEYGAVDDDLNINAGHWARISGHHEVSFFRYLTCAMRRRGDEEAWAQAIGSAIQEIVEASNQGRTPKLLLVMALVLNQALHFVGENVAERLIDIIPMEEYSLEMRDSVHQAILGMTRNSKNEERPKFVLRFFGDQDDENGYEEYIYGDSAEVDGGLDD